MADPQAVVEATAAPQVWEVAAMVDPQAAVEATVVPLA